MKVDIGFFDINGNYIEDIQELNEIERKEIMETKNFNEFFDELNDMANFKNFGEKEETEEKPLKQCQECVCKSCEQVAWLEQENAEFKAYKDVNEDFKKAWEELKDELQKFKDMAKKGLDEFKDVGGCWGCGLQLQLNQDMEDITKLKAENERLKEEIKEKLEIYEKIKDKSAVFTSEFTLASGGVTALKEILELFEKRSNEKVNELEKENKIIRSLNASSAYDIDKLLKKQNRYKQTLQEIKAIAEKRNYLDYGEALDDILDLITKVEEE